MTILTEKGRADLRSLGEAFGDPRRRAIYEHVAEAGEPLTAADLAAAFGLHRTVVRTHLEHLVATGLLTSELRHSGHSGRPAKAYGLSSQRFEVSLPPRRYETLARLLLEMVTAMPEDEQAEMLAAAVGRAWGRSLASAGRFAMTDDGATPLERAVALFASVGQRLRLDESSTPPAIEAGDCPFRELAGQAPGIVCTMHCSALKGLLAIEDTQHSQTSSIARGDAFCRHEVVL